MDYVVYFTRAGTPETGLSPTIDVFRRTDTGAAVTPPAVVELAGGLYRFSYTPTVTIGARIDSNDATMADADRYVFMRVCPTNSISISRLCTELAEEVMTASIAAYKTNEGSLAQILHYLLRRAIGRARKVGSNLVVYDDDGSTVMLTIPITPEEYGPPA